MSTKPLSPGLARAKREGWLEWVCGPADEAAVEAGHYFDLAAAERVRQFFHKFLRHSTGKWAGQPFILLEWEWRDVIAPLFGWKKADGSRRFRRGYLSCAKKNGKTGLLSGLALYFLLADGEAGAVVYSAASDRNQAAEIYREAVKMIDAGEQLQRVCKYVNSTKTIVGTGHSYYRALSAEAKTKDGPNASAILFDELHAQPNRDLWDKLTYAGSARRQPLMLAITTAGSDKETICGEQYEYAKRILDGSILDDHSFFACIYEAAASDDWTKEETWRKANPSLGETIALDVFQADYVEARESPAKENTFRRYRCNQWVQTADAWLSMDQWDACAGPMTSAEIAAAMIGRECSAGLDLSATDDTTALVLTFPSPDGSYDLLPYFWLPEDNILALEKKHRVPYLTWSRLGLFELTPGNVVDYAKIRAKLRDLATVFKIKELSIDRKFQGQALENDLIEDGFNVVPAGQGWVSQDVPAKELEKLLKGGLLRHGAHPVLRWHASNVVVDIDKNNNYSINKKKSRSKIDGMAATLMALMSELKGGKPKELYVNSNPKLMTA